MTDPRYVSNLADIYTEMYNPSGKERPLTEAHSEDHDYDIPKWKRLLNQHAQKEKLHRGQHPVVIEPREDASEDEENSKSLTLNEEEINVVQEALTRLEPESFSRDEFYNEEEVNRMLYIAQDILKRSGVE